MTARIYVGTYAKYSEGSIAKAPRAEGAWLDLEDYADAEEFAEACKALHADEEDPELMFHDYDGFPEDYYSESSLDAAIWDWLELDEDDREMLSAYRDAVDSTGTIEQARDAYMGKADSEADYAKQYADDTRMLEYMPEHLRWYFDFERLARDLFMCYFTMANGYVFSRF